MELTPDSPDGNFTQIRTVEGDGPARSTVERLALSGFLDGTLSRYQVQRLLGFDNRWDTEEWLGSRGGHVQYSAADLELDRANLDRLLNR